MANTTKILVDKYGMSLEQIAVALGCSFNAVRGWYVKRTKPIPVFQRRLDDILEAKADVRKAQQ